MTDRVDHKNLKLLALSRAEEAELLFKGGYPSGAYYLAGYSIELSLKSYYCKQKLFPPKDTKDLYNHNLETLLQSCGLKSQFDKAVKKDKQLGAAWGVVKDWTEESRYKFHKKEKTEDFLNAVNKILLWIKKKI